MPEAQTPAPAQQPEASPETLETSSSQPAPEGETEGRFEEPDFSELVDASEYGERDEVPGEAEVEAVAAETETPPPASQEAETEVEVETPPEVTPPAEVEPPAQEAASEGEEVPAVEPEPEPEPETKLPTKEEMQGLYEDFKKETMPTLEKLYEMDDELAAAYDENPRTVLPKLAAQIHYDSMMSSYNAVMAALPSVVGRYMQATRLSEQASSTFFDAWPKLNDPKLEPVVRTAIQSYRTANPTATLDDVVKKAGLLAMIQAGLDPTEVKEEKPALKPRAKPATPVAPGAGNSITPPAQEEGEVNIFDAMATAFDKDRF